MIEPLLLRRPDLPAGLRLRLRLLLNADQPSLC